MSKIEDFGEKLHGAAKDRWRAYGIQIANARHVDVLEAPLSKSFPEPAYGRLIEDGLDPWVVGLVRTARDIVPPKLRVHGVRSWAAQVSMLRDICCDLIEGRISADRLREKLAEPKFSRLKTQIEGGVALYMRFGHERSLKGTTLMSRVDRATGKPEWLVVGKGRMGPGSRQILARGGTADEALDAFASIQGGAGPARRSGKTRFKLYQYRSDPEGKVWIGAVIGKRTVDLKSFDDVRSARLYLAENEDMLTERVQRIRKFPDLRRAENLARSGPDRLQGEDVTPEAFLETFRFRGVQFGNHVEGPRRQQDLNNAWQSLMDMSEVLGCDPSDLSLGGRLGIAFGARGTGGIHAASAHYEADTVVINLTKARGAGSLAHEWFHAIDNVAARESLGPLAFSTESRHGHAEFRELVDRIGSVDLDRRSATLDLYRSSPYYHTPVEMAARAFETWVMTELEARGIINDHLVNIVPEGIWRAECELSGQNPESWPYPRPSEMDLLGSTFRTMFRSPEIRAIMRHGAPLPDDDRPEP